jgi:hypothetical protein
MVKRGSEASPHNSVKLRCSHAGTCWKGSARNRPRVAGGGKGARVQRQPTDIHSFYSRRASNFTSRVATAIVKKTAPTSMP